MSACSTGNGCASGSIRCAVRCSRPIAAVTGVRWSNLECWRGAGATWQPPSPDHPSPDRREEQEEKNKGETRPRHGLRRTVDAYNKPERRRRSVPTVGITGPSRLTKNAKKQLIEGTLHVLTETYQVPDDRVYICEVAVG